jgi:hypothetical protein
MPNQDKTFISDRESGTMEWITLDEVCRKTKEERQRLARLIWRNNIEEIV